MIKVLLLDDEKLALEYLENIVSWEMYGFEIVGALTDAEQALKAYRRTRPDLVISDVCMYGMDGLDFAASIREIDQNTHILFLSGYKNFDYVQEAIRLGIDDYLLKSDIDEEVFLKKILRIKEKIEREHQKKKYTESAIFKELFIKDREETAYKDILGETEYIRLHKKYYYLLVSPKKFPRFLNDFFPGMEQENSLDEGILRQLVQKQLIDQNIENIATFFVNDSELLVILEAKGFVSQKEIYEKIYHLSKTVFLGINQTDRYEYNLFYYPRGCAVRQFGRLYKENKEQFNLCYVKKEPQLMEFELDKKSFPETKGENSFSSEQVYKAIQNREYGQINEYLEALMIAVESEDYITYLWYLKEMMEAIRQTEKSLKNICRNTREFSLAEAVNQFNLCKPQEVIRFLRYKFEEIEKAFRELQSSSYSQSIRDAIDFIQKNYAQEDLSTNTVARQVNLSISWLSTKFKEEVGVGISDYLNSIRIRHAKRLFEEQDFMIYEVAERVGFASSQYFSKIFKQITGVTPNEYKRINGGQEENRNG